ncbi:bifunctional methylenetetrahydrofolate dehydrogenase/methenyltetrahydrofolate cyclohydrolase FolD [Candidatus Sumerlaeota bacterium]|nr:bifunctional methylenetetrahydrofolate dehydrogenase/methenyltetrahydrofolate cyclohydrolase FolD [Candidatus Sumerlaeota bacterium]
MSAKIIDGKKIAEQIRQEIAQQTEQLKTSRGITPGLAVVLVGNNPASEVYVRNKQKACEKIGLLSELHRFPEDASQDLLLKKISELNHDDKIHGILVQLPLPPHINEQSILQSIRPEKDVDGFHPVNMGKLAQGEPGFVPCTPLGIREMLLRENIPIQGQHVVIVGRSNIVGKPLALLLMQKSEKGNATVTVCHSRTKNLADITRQADILVAAIGRAQFITRDMVRPGAVVIDVGVNRIEDAYSPKGYRLVGDVDFDAVKEIASAITPVPGGVGPMTITMLLNNTLQAATQMINN